MINQPLCDSSGPWRSVALSEAPVGRKPRDQLVLDHFQDERLRWNRLRLCLDGDLYPQHPFAWIQAQGHICKIMYTVPTATAWSNVIPEKHARGKKSLKSHVSTTGSACRGLSSKTPARFSGVSYSSASSVCTIILTGIKGGRIPLVPFFQSHDVSLCPSIMYLSI